LARLSYEIQSSGKEQISLLKLWGGGTEKKGGGTGIVSRGSTNDRMEISFLKRKTTMKLTRKIHW